MIDMAKSSPFDGQDDRRYRGADDCNHYTREEDSHGRPVARQDLVANVERPKQCDQLEHDPRARQDRCTGRCPSPGPRRLEAPETQERDGKTQEQRDGRYQALAISHRQGGCALNARITIVCFAHSGPEYRSVEPIRRIARLTRKLLRLLAIRCRSFFTAACTDDLASEVLCDLARGLRGTRHLTEQVAHATSLATYGLS